MGLCINFVLLLLLRFGIYLHLVTANKILTNYLKVGVVMDRDPNSSSQNVKALNKL
jgi:hypothetical protein